MKRNQPAWKSLPTSLVGLWPGWATRVMTRPQQWVSVLTKETHVVALLRIILCVEEHCGHCEQGRFHPVTLATTLPVWIHRVDVPGARNLPSTSAGLWQEWVTPVMTRRQLRLSVLTKETHVVALLCHLMCVEEQCGHCEQARLR